MLPSASSVKPAALPLPSILASASSGRVIGTSDRFGESAPLAPGTVPGPIAAIKKKADRSRQAWLRAKAGTVTFARNFVIRNLLR